MIRQAVLAALDASGIAIEAVDTFVTVAGDSLDGISVPGRAEVAGTYGRRYLNLPSGAGHGLGAAVTQIEAGEAETVVLVGWGAATRYRELDPRRNQADPFHARPIGASPRVVAALQAQELLSANPDGEAALEAYAATMARRAWSDGVTASGAGPVWAHTSFCDGAVAIVLRRGEAGVVVGEFATVSRPYAPEDDRLDPAAWVAEALGSLPSAAATPGQVVEAAAPTPIAETRVLAALGVDPDDGLVNASGGGAIAHFGAATGLRQLAVASRRLAAADASRALVLDLAGPLGQHVTAIMLARGATA